MRILIASMHYAPEATGNAPYVTDFAEHLARDGNDVHVLCGVPYYPQWRVSPEYRYVIRRNERLNGVTVHRHRQYVPRNPSAMRRAMSEATYLATGLIVEVPKKADAIVGVIPTVADGLMAASIAQRLDIPYGLVFQDLVSVGAAQSGVASNRITSLLTSLERRIVARAKGIGVVATGFRPYLKALGASEDRIFQLRNWNRLTAADRDLHATRRSLKLPNDAIMCLHAGNMGAKQALENVVECAALAQNCSSRLYFVLMGDGNQQAVLARLVDHYQLRNVRFLDPQPNGTYASVLRAADILIVNQRCTLTDMALPSKLTAYFAAGRPVVAAVHPESEAARELERASAGVICDPENPAALLKMLEELVSKPGLRRRLGINGANYCKNHLASESILPRWASFVDFLANSSPAQSMSSVGAASCPTSSSHPAGTWSVRLEAPPDS